MEVPIVPIGNMVKALRILHNMYQDELCQRSGLNRNIIVDIENNRRAHIPAEVAALETAFNIDFETVAAHLAPLVTDLPPLEHEEEVVAA